MRVTALSSLFTTQTDSTFLAGLLVIRVMIAAPAGAGPVCYSFTGSATAEAGTTRDVCHANPTGATILGRQGILDAYRTGKGSVKMRAVAEIEESRGTTRIVVTEFPYQTSVEVVEKKIADLVHARELDGISRTQNDSAGRQARLVIELKRDANAHGAQLRDNRIKEAPAEGARSPAG